MKKNRLRSAVRKIKRRKMNPPSPEDMEKLAEIRKAAKETKKEIHAFLTRKKKRYVPRTLREAVRLGMLRTEIKKGKT